MLKQLIQRLLDSRTTPEEAAHSAMPSDKYTRLVDNGTIGSEWTDQAFSGIAAYDGYLFFTGTSTSAVPIIGIATAGYASNLTFPWEGARLATTIPIAKGQTWTVQGSSMKDVIIYLSKTVSLGGGYQALNQLLLQGDVLCRLSRLYSSLRRSSCRVRRNGSEVKVFSQTQIPEQRSLLTTLRLSFIRLQVMDGLHSAETGHRSMSALPESWERVALTLKVISELQLRFGRGIPLVSIARQTISNRLRQNSFPAKGQRNTSLVGGASC